jgi:hypothetical protein
MTYDITTAAGKVRRLINDTDTANHLYSDQEIEAFLSLCQESIFLAAALALETLAANEVLVQKRIQLLDLSTDGPAEARALRQLAESYRHYVYLESPTVANADAFIAWDLIEQMDDDADIRTF